MDVSRETIATNNKVKHYHALLLKWQKALNIVAPSTLKDSMDRHFYDSAQLLKILPDTPFHWIDLGSGGGFPGLVLACLRPDIDVTLVESDQKKSIFMQTVIRENGLKNCTTINERIEKATINLGEKPVIVGARALASLEQLFDYVAGFGDIIALPRCFFLKGQRAREEISLAEKNWSFDVEKHVSETDRTAKILDITNLVKRT